MKFEHDILDMNANCIRFPLNLKSVSSRGLADTMLTDFLSIFTYNAADLRINKGKLVLLQMS